jgi:hypothetical protein
MSAAIGRLLTQFDPSGREKLAEKARITERAPPPKEPRLEAAAPAKTEPSVNLLDEAYRRGYAAGVANSEAKLAEERVHSAVRLGEERAKWSDRQALAIVTGLAESCRELEANIAGSLARILQPFLADEIREKTIAALVDHISALTSDPSRPAFRITGPSDLLEVVRRKLATMRTVGIVYETADIAEVRLVADQTVIETQMLAWIGRLKEAGR